MSKLNIISLTLVAALYLSHLNFTSASVHKEELNYPDQRVIFTPQYYSGETLLYAVCGQNFQPQENHCTVIRRNDVLQNETLVSCNVTLKAEQTEGNLGPKYELLPYDENKAMFISAEIGQDTFVKLSTIHLDTCKITVTKLHVDFPYEEALVLVVPTGDSAKVLFDNAPKCGADKMCVMSLDSEGRKTGLITSISKGMRPRSSPVVAPMGADLFLIKPEGRIIRNFILRKPDGSEKSIGKYSFKPRSVVLSTANDLIGVCHDILARKSNIVCTQHDASGQLKFEFTSTDLYEQLKLKSMHNLPAGGILLVADSSDGISIIKVDAQGNMVGSIGVDDFECSIAFATATSFFETDNKEHCVSLACREGNDFYIVSQSFLKLETHCFADADITN